MESQSHPNNDRSYSFKLFRVLLYVILALLALHMLLQYLNLEVFYQQNGQAYELSNRFDFDDEASVPTWFSQFQFLFIGVAAGTAAWLEKAKASKRLWAFIAGLGLILSVDEIAGLHEFVLQTLHVLFFQDDKPSALANAWLIVAPFVLLAMGWLVWKMVRVFSKRTIFLFVGAGATFLTGAIGIDLVASVAERETFLNQGVLVGIEEFFELLANALSIYAILDFLEHKHASFFRRIIAKENL